MKPPDSALKKVHRMALQKKCFESRKNIAGIITV